MNGLLLSLALLGQQPTATYTSVVTITQPPAAVVLVPAPVQPPKVIFGVMPGAPTSGYTIREEMKTATSVFTRTEAVGPAPLIQLKRGLFGRYRIVK